MRPALIVIAGALNEREASLIEDGLEVGKPRVQPERDARGIAADLQHPAGGHRDRRTPAVIRRVVIGNEHAQGVVPSAQIQDDQVASVRSLRAGEIAQKVGRGKSHRERGDTASDERPAGDFHTN